MPGNLISKKVLITGASGFIGSFLVEEGIRNGYEVYAGVRSSSNRAFLQNKLIRFFQIDLSSQLHMEQKLNSFNRSDGGFDYIIHNAGITRGNKKDDFKIVNYHFTKNLVNAILASGRLPEKFIYISSMAASGPGNPVNFEPITSFDIDHPISAYAKSKLNAENYLRSIHPLHSVIVRPTAVYGPRDKDFLGYFRMIANGIEIFAGSRKQLLSFVYVKDISKIIFRILGSANTKTSYIISDGKAYEKEDIGNIIRKIMNKKTIKIKLPLPPLIASVFCMEKIYSLFGRMPFLHTEKLKEITAPNWSCDSSGVWDEFDLNPEYTLEKGLLETVIWCKEMGWLH